VKRLALALAFVALTLVGACGSDHSQDTSSGANEQSNGGTAHTSALEAAYSDAFKQACSDVWSNSGDGNLYYQGDAYTEDDCSSQIDETNADGLSDVAEAQDQGKNDGYDAAFAVSDELCYGRECWTRSDF
jgi:hypothetical protein